MACYIKYFTDVIVFVLVFFKLSADLCE